MSYYYRSKKVSGVSINEDTVEIQLYSCLNLDLEISQALRCSDKFKEVYGKTLTIKKVCSNK
nr:hypothetical protein [Clostridium paraputrificum]